MAQSRKTSKLGNQEAKVLTKDENQALFSYIGNRCLTLSTAVVQVFLAKPPAYNQWSKFCCGVATFVKDNVKRSYFIRVYDLKLGAVIWEQEMYNNFKYKCSRPYFHTFDTDDCPAGLNFANDEEANHFMATVNEKIRSRDDRRKTKRAASNTAVSSSYRPAPPAVPTTNTQMARPPMLMSSAAPPNLPNIPVDSGKNTVRKNDKKDKKGKGKVKLTKDDIGTPTDFRHVGHVGWDPNKGGWDMDNLDPDLKGLFDKLGLSEKELEDKETAQFIYDFIEQNGGIDAVRQQRQNVTMTTRPVAPPVPPSSVAHYPPTSVPPPPPNRNAPPPRPVDHGRSAAPPPPPPPQRDAPARNLGPPPPVPTMSRGQLAAPPLPGRSGPPPVAPPPPPSGVPHPPAFTPGPPPPPPPPPTGPVPPPPPPLPSSGIPPAPPSMGAGRGGLLEQIQAGTPLRSRNAAESAGSESSGDSRNALMESIRSGQTSLKPVDAVERPKSEAEDEGGLVGALARALASRQAALKGNDSDVDENDDDDEEWDD